MNNGMSYAIRTAILCFGLVLALALPSAAADADARDKESISDLSEESGKQDPKKTEAWAAPQDKAAGRTINEGTSFDRDPRNNTDGGQEHRDLGDVGKIPQDGF